MNRRKLGTRYEHAAARYLEANGFEVVARNYRYSRNEIDLICCKGSELIFVEVKGQRSESFGPAHYRVDERKQQAIIEAAQGYLAGAHATYESYRFDVVIVTERGNDLDVEHIEGAFTL